MIFFNAVKTFALITFLSLATVHAQTTISVYDIKGLHNADHSGGYDTILLAIKNKGVELELQHNPIIRAKQLFHTQQVNCISPSDGLSDPFPFATVQTDPLNKSKAFIFTHEDSPIISHLSQLKDMQVGVRKGLEYGSKLDPYNLNLQPVWDTEHNYKKLLAKRIDAFIAYIPDIWGYFNTAKIPQVNYDPNSPIIVSNESVVCHDTPKNRIFIKQFNPILKQLKAEGFIKKSLGVSYNLD